MSMWDARYASEEFSFGTQPNDFLVEASTFLPAGGHVVSLGEGEGRNGVWLAEQGFRVTAIDGSAVGLDKAARLAASRGVGLETVVGDLAELALPADADAIISIFCHLPSDLRRSVYQRAKAALRPGGVAIFESYHPDQLGFATGGPSDVDMLLSLEDLMHDWEGTDCLLGREIVREVNEGKRHSGRAAVTQAVFRKPA
ncbi:MAG: thiopurine S-methyltransferase [Chthonomonadales bacterium]|nr:thiopurine S-methyltransferase [Chthonomonadales bacterium]